jgi:enoyl-CoA hydratase/carnithine racemase
VTQSPAPDYRSIALTVHDRIARITLDRPDRLNALDPTMLEELLDALARIGRVREVNALVLQARGRMFSAGVDLDTPFFMEHVTDDSIYAGTRLLDEQHRVIRALFELPVVTVAALNGDACGGGGLGLAMACDLRVAVRGARFWMVPGMLDVVQDFGLSWMVQRVVGPSRALQMAVLGERVDAERALQWGLVNELVDDPAGLAARVDALGAQLGAMGGDALRMLKLVLRNGERAALPEQLAVEAVANGLAFQSREFAQKKAAYLASLAARRKT